MSALDQGFTKIRVPGLCDSELWVESAGLRALWTQAEISSHISTRRKSLFVFDCENKCKRRNWDDTRLSSKNSCFGISFLGDSLDAFVVRLDVFGQVSNLTQQRLKHCS